MHAVPRAAAAGATPGPGLQGVCSSRLGPPWACTPDVLMNTPHRIYGKLHYVIARRTLCPIHCGAALALMHRKGLSGVGVTEAAGGPLIANLSMSDLRGLTPER